MQAAGAVSLKFAPFLSSYLRMQWITQFQFNSELMLEREYWE